MLQYRTDLAMEAHELLCARSRAQTLSGVDSRTVFRRGCSVTSVRIDTEGAARQLGKPRGRYVTLDLSPLQKNADDVLERASRAVGAELRALLGENVKSVLVAGLGNANMTPDAIGPRSAEHVLVTRHLRQNGAFSAFCSVSVLTPGVLGRTGIEAMETLRGTVRAVQPDAVIAIDALASRSLMRLCSTVQLSDTGIVPGSGVGNHRCPLSRDTLGVPVYAIGVPTVVDAATLTLDVLEEAGKSDVDPAALRGHETVMVTTRDIDAQIRELARVIATASTLRSSRSIFPSSARSWAENVQNFPVFIICLQPIQTLAKIDWYLNTCKGELPRCDFLLLKIHTQHSKKLLASRRGLLFLFLFFAQAQGSCGTGAGCGESSAWRCTDKGGYSLLEREYPLNPREKGRGFLPSTLTLAVCGSKSCAACGIGCGVRGFATNPFISSPFPQPRPTPWGASDGSTAADCLRGAALLRSPRVGLLLFYFNSVLFCERSAAYGNTHRTAARFGIKQGR